MSLGSGRDEAGYELRLQLKHDTRPDLEDLTDFYCRNSLYTTSTPLPSASTQFSPLSPIYISRDFYMTITSKICFNLIHNDLLLLLSPGHGL